MGCQQCDVMCVLSRRADRRQIKARWSPSTTAEAESPRVHSPGSAASAPASPATPRPPAMAAQQAQQPGDSSPDPSLPCTPKAAAAMGSEENSAQPATADSQQAMSRRAHSQPLNAKAPAAPDSIGGEQALDEPRSQTSLLRPKSAQDQGSRLQSTPHLSEPGTAQKGRPRSLTFPLPHQRHLEPSRLSPQTPLTSAPGSQAKVSLLDVGSVQHLKMAFSLSRTHADQKVTGQKTSHVAVCAGQHVFPGTGVQQPRQPRQQQLL